MYDSSRTKLLKNVFDNHEVIDMFIATAMRLQGELSLEKLYQAQLEKVYLQYKKIFRDKFFKDFCQQNNILSDKKGLKFENAELVNNITDCMKDGIECFANNFTKNRTLPESEQKSLKLVCYDSAKYCINKIDNDPVIIRFKNSPVELVELDNKETILA